MKGKSKMNGMAKWVAIILTIFIATASATWLISNSISSVENNAKCYADQKDEGVKKDIGDRLDRIEQKLDQLIMKGK